LDQAVRIAGIQDFILGLPDRYETPIGERGANLSEGQRQRISIARALIKDPDILIMDEPTASVDVLAEHSIFEALPQVMQHKTLIVVTHRPASMQKADRILLLNNGRLTASGTHEQLQEQDAYYRSLFMK
jgi:ABC-type multidrug transport system fused ATPase/permease subunit